MKIQSVIVLSFIVVATSCGTKKVASTTPNKGKASTHSQADFPYIEAFHAGIRFKLKGDVDAAITAFQKCLEIKQNDDAVYYALGQLYGAKKNPTVAIEMIGKAASIDPKNIWYTEELAVLYYDNQQFEKAIPQFKKLTEHTPTNLAWLFGYGDCLLRTGKVNESIQVLNKAEDVMGKNPNLSLEKYNMYMNLKNEKEALAELESILKEYPDEPQLIATMVDHYFKKGDIENGMKFLKDLVVADPENGRAHLTLGEIYRQQGKVGDAFKEYNAAFKSQDVDVDTKMSLLIALQDTPLSSTKEAMELVEMMSVFHPEDAKSHSIKGDYLMLREDEQAALMSYKTALKFEKKQFPIWNQILLLEYQNGMWSELYTDSKECLEYFTTMPIVYLLHGVSANQQNKPQEAIDALLSGKALLVSDLRMEAEFFGQLGDAYFKSKDYTNAQASYKEAIRKDPESNLLKNNYAYRLAKAKIDLELALSLVTQAIDKSPTQPHYYDTRGWVYFQQGKFDAALKDIQKAVELDSDNAAYIEHLGDVYSKLNQKEKALEQWEAALKLGSKSTSIHQKIATKTYHEELD